MTYTIYKYTFPNGMVYVGMTKYKVHQRKWYGYHHNSRITAAIKEYGWENVKTDTLYQTDNIDDAYSSEKEWIAKTNSTNPKIGYNISYGGKSTFEGLKHTQQYKEYMSSLYTGRRFSEETLQNMKEAHKKECHAVASLDKHGNAVRHYDSLGEAANDVGGYKTNISRACKTGKIYKGVFWKEIVEGGDLG